MNPLVIDISHYQPDPINWKQLKDAGTVGVIHKATEGTSYVDDKLFDRAKPAMDAGLCWSTYHFLRPGKIKEQMDHYLGTVDPREGERVCLDHEDPGVSLDDLCECVEHLIFQRPDLELTIYSGNLIKEQLGDKENEFLAKTTSLWIAQYTSAEEPVWPYKVWPAWSLWQFTDRGTAVGITGNVDSNRWNGSDEALVEWFGPASEAPAPSGRSTVDVAIETSKDVMVSVTVNGELLLAAAYAAARSKR